MKVRDSGMPEWEYWESLFDIPLILDRMRVRAPLNTLVEFGCGYGTFTLPAARRIPGRVVALDIDEEMVAPTRRRAVESGIDNIDFALRDFIADGTGLTDGAADYAMLFNILHHERPEELLREAYRSLRPGGFAGIIHWNHDPATPRGPKMEMRPKPADLRAQALMAGFRVSSSQAIDLPPWHYGWLAEKPA